METKEKKKELLFLWMLAVFLLAVNVLTFQGQAETELVKVSGTAHLSEKAKEYTDVFQEKSQVLEQRFKPQMENLDRIRIRFYLVNRNEDRGKVGFSIRLYDGQGKVVQEEEFYLSSIAHRYYTFYVGAKVDTEDTYCLEIRPFTEIPVAGGQPVSIRCLISQEKVPESMGCTMNGEDIGGNIDVLYSYKYHSMRPFGKMLVGDVSLAGFLLLLRFLKKKRREDSPLVKGLQWVLWAMVPAVMFVIMELLADNWGTITGKNVLYNILLLLVLYLVFCLCFTSQRLAGIVFSFFLASIGLLEYYVLAFRGRAFTIFDLFSAKTAMEVAGGYSFAMPLRKGLCLLLLFAVAALLFYHQGMVLHKNRVMSAIRISGIGAFAAVIFLLLKMDLLHNFQVETLSIWNAKDNYMEKGSMYTFLLECQYIHVNKPEAYSLDYVKRIEEGLDNQEKEAVTPENLIIIMNESLTDMEKAGNLKTEDEILPYIHSMEKNTVKGFLQMPIFGGGTADSEYEVLTGNTKQFLPGATVAYEFYCSDPEYGLVDHLKSQGYRTVALHPHRRGNWNRALVYGFMGFDQFISKDEWGDMDIIRKGDSDENTYQKIIEMVEKKKKGEKLFTFLVTMQNHGGFSDMGDGFVPTVTLNYEESYPLAETYLSLAQLSDRAFQMLIERLEKVEEPTMVVMFGDHYPSVEEGFYAQLFGKSVETMSLEEQQIRYQTPYVIWTNYDHGKLDGQGEMISANYFGSYIMQQAGLRLSEYDDFLLKMMETIPVVGNGAVMDHKGIWYGMDDLPGEYRELVESYSVLQYNRVRDRDNLCRELFTIKEGKEKR